jgi:hypothetical protein
VSSFSFINDARSNNIKYNILLIPNRKLQEFQLTNYRNAYCLKNSLLIKIPSRIWVILFSLQLIMSGPKLCESNESTKRTRSEQYGLTPASARSVSLPHTASIYSSHPSRAITDWCSTTRTPLYLCQANIFAFNTKIFAGISPCSAFSSLKHNWLHRVLISSVPGSPCEDTTIRRKHFTVTKFKAHLVQIRTNYVSPR